MVKRSMVMVLVVFSVYLILASGVFASDAAGTNAVVTAIQGTTRVYTKGSTKGHLLKKGDILGKEHEVQVAEKSRIEIRFPDGSVMRLSEKTRLKMNDISFNKQTDSKSVKVGLSMGKLWAKVKKLTTSDSTVEVRTSNAVAGVRGTVYRVNVDEDKSATVKVYDGSVYVANPPQDASKTGDRSLAPHEVAGPHAVPPPFHEVSREEWTAIVKAMQQITISPEGVPSKPEDFDPKADADDWVKWNQGRDKELAF